MSATPTLEPLYCVAIRHNIVTCVAIAPHRSDVIIHSDPLAVSTAVARRMQEYGCLDGDYHFADLSMARRFASVAMDFTSKMVARTADALVNAEIKQDGWINRFVPVNRK